MTQPHAKVRRMRWAAASAALVGALVITTGGLSSAVPVASNSPWYPSLSSFEHFDSARSHVFSQAYFGGSLSGKNVVTSRQSATDQYPSGYNMVYKDASHAYIYGGGYGNYPGSVGAFVDQVDPVTLASVWHTQLMDFTTTDPGVWDYPGVMGMLSDGNLYVTYSHKLAKIDPTDGHVIATLDLPYNVNADPNNASYNGFNATSDGVLVFKSVYRPYGCTAQGPTALSPAICPANPSAATPTTTGWVPPSEFVSVDPFTMTVLHQLTLPAPAGARPTVARFNGKNYAYLVEGYGPCKAVRYEVGSDGTLTLDPTWAPLVTQVTGQTATTSLVVLKDWVAVANNSIKTTVPMSVTAISQADATKIVSMQPFATDTPDPWLVSELGGATSMVGASLSADASSNLLYVFDTVPRKIAALRLSVNGPTPKLTTVWKKTQTTTEFTLLIGDARHRVLVSTDIPTDEVPGRNANGMAVWRDAATGRELARSAVIPAMTWGSMIQPFYNGDLMWEGELGTLYRLSPRKAHHKHK